MNGSAGVQLSEFIASHRAEFLAQWEAEVRRTLPESAALSSEALRNHLPAVLDRIARIISGALPAASSALAEPTEAHVRTRLDAGIGTATVARELTLLRHLILRAWQREAGDGATSLDELAALDEAIDDVIARSLDAYSRARDRTFAALDRLARTSSRSDDPTSVLRQLVAAVLESHEAADCGLVLLKQGEELMPGPGIACGGFAELDATERLIGALAGRIAAERWPAQVRAADGGGSWLAPALRELSLRALYAAPLLDHDEVVGVILIGSRTAPEFPPADERLFGVIAQRASAIVVEARLLERERRASVDLRRTSYMLRAFLDELPMLAYIKGADGSYQQVNRAWEQLTGVEREHGIGKTDEAFFPPEVAAMLRANDAAVLESRAAVEFDETGPVHGSVRSFRSLKFPLVDGSGRPFAIGGISEDVTERRKAERELREMADYLELGDAFFAMDRDYRLVRVNAAQERLSQKPRSETLGRVFWDLWPETRDPQGPYWREYHRAMEQRTPAHFEDYYAPLDLWTDVSAFPTAAGGIAVFFRDATARKRAEVELRHQTALTRTVLDNANSGFVMLDAAGVATFANVEACRALGYAAEELLGRPLHGLLHPDAGACREGECELYQALASSSPARHKESSLATRSGRSFPVEYGVAPVLVDGRRAGAVFEFRDITERKAAEEAARRSQQQLERIFSMTPVMLCVVSLDGRILRTNPAMQEALGYSEATLTSLSLLELVHPEDREHGLGERRKLDAGVQQVSATLRCRRADGEYRWFAWIASRDPATSTLFAAARDITDDKHRTEFEQHLLGIVSHDLRNPLHTIALTAALATRRAEQLDEATAEAFGRISAAADRANGLIRDLLDFTRARLGGGIPVVPQPSDLSAIARGVLDELRANFAGHDLRLESERGCTASFDPARMAQVVANLVTNALKYGAPNTPVTVRTYCDAGGLVLQVHNLGAPIPEAVRPHLFEPMRRGSEGGERAAGSLGLGLYIVNEIVRRHGGRIEFESTSEAGTTFTVHLPGRA